MAATTGGRHPGQQRYPPELRERAVRMVLESIDRGDERFGTVTRIATQLGIGTESLRNGCARPRSTGAAGPGPRARTGRIAELERENRELRRPTRSCGAPRLSSRRSSTPPPKR